MNTRIVFFMNPEDSIEMIKIIGKNKAII